MARLQETFFSVQGEGDKSGRPTYFVRFDGCNLDCSWCDQPAALTNRPQHRASIEMSPYEIAEVIQGFPLSVDVCFTGGEPTQQHEALREVIQILRAGDQHRLLTMETNGTLFIRQFAEDSNAFLSCSPKFTLVRINQAAKAHGQKAIEQWMDSGVPMQFKFVVESEAMFDSIVAWAVETVPQAGRYLIPLVFQPEFFKGQEEFRGLLKRLFSGAEEWKKIHDLGFESVRFMPQSHKILKVR
jgi:organic radical activating enzyme